jgi:outer membrane beta-barrel protein
MNALLLITVLVAAQEEGGGMDFGLEGTEEPKADTPPAEAAPPAAPVEAEAPVQHEETDVSALDEGIDLTLNDRIKAVSRKVFLKEGRFELAPLMSVTTNDPFFRTWALGGRAAWHVNDAFAIEGGATYVPPFFVEELPPLDLLRERASLINVDAKLAGSADMGVTFSPVYGKIAILSDAIIHFDTFVAAGGGVVLDNNGDLFGADDARRFTGMHPTMDVGAGLRVFLLRWLVVRADLRDYVYPQDRDNISTLQNLLVVNLGVGFFLPPDFEYKYEASKVRR